MPLTEFQKAISKLLAKNRSEDSYLAGGAALLLKPNSTRYSNDLDYFQDTEERVAKAFNSDKDLLKKNGYGVSILINQVGYMRAIISKDEVSCKVEWAHDTAWRFMPTQYDEQVGFILHSIDLAINKILALVGRDEARDLLDTLECHTNILSLGALCWAAAGKDPGYTPSSILEMLKRRGKIRKEQIQRLHLAVEIDLIELKQAWLKAIKQAELFIQKRPMEEIGCLYYNQKSAKFVDDFSSDNAFIIPHYGRPGGVLPTHVSD